LVEAQLWFQGERKRLGAAGTGSGQGAEAGRQAQGSHFPLEHRGQSPICCLCKAPVYPSAGAVVWSSIAGTSPFPESQHWGNFQAIRDNLKSGEPQAHPVLGFSTGACCPMAVLSSSQSPSSLKTHLPPFPAPVALG
jgi:hypothetical protein